MDDPRDGVHQAVQALVEGACVRLPLSDGMRATLIASRDAEIEPEQDAVAGGTWPACLLFDSVEHASDFLPRLTPTQARVVLRSSPGDFIFEVDREPGGPLDELPDSVRQLVATDSTVFLRLSGAAVADAVLSLLPAPLVTGPDGSLPAASLEVLDHREAQPAPSVLRLSKGGVKLVRVAAVDEAALRGMMGLQIVLVCTGNTCRSPMAAEALRLMLARELDVQPRELIGAGVNVLSAGIAARNGSPASPEAVDAIQEFGGDLSDHRSQPATLEMLQAADAVFTMTQGHRATIISQVPELRDLVQPLSPDGRDVDDPIGAPANVYRACLAQMQDALKARLPDLLTLIEQLQATERNEDAR